MKTSLGILMLDSKFPRIPGDVGNEASFPFPIQKLVVQGASPQRVVLEGDRALLEPFLAAATELEHAGVSAITTSCGFLAMFQQELAAQVKIPVFTSSLLQVAQVSALLPAGKKVGIMTADSRNLDNRHFNGAGIADVPKVVYGMEGTSFHDTFVSNGATLDFEAAETSMIAVARRMIAECPEVDAIVFECTNMPPYAKAVADATGLPVYDFITLAEYVMSGLNKKSFI